MIIGRCEHSARRPKLISALMWSFRRGAFGTVWAIEGQFEDAQVQDARLDTILRHKIEQQTEAPVQFAMSREGCC